MIYLSMESIVNPKSHPPVIICVGVKNIWLIGGNFVTLRLQNERSQLWHRKFFTDNIFIHTKNL